MKYTKIKSLAATLAKSNAQKYYFYPKGDYKMISALMFFNCSALSLIYFYLVDFQFDFYLLGFIAFYCLLCLGMLIYGSNCVIIEGRDITVKSFWGKRQLQMVEVSHLLRETKRVSSLMSSRVRLRVVSYYLQTKEQTLIALTSKIREPEMHDQYPSSLEYKVDLLLKDFAVKHQLAIIFSDLDYQYGDNYKYRADFIRGMTGIAKADHIKAASAALRYQEAEGRSKAKFRDKNENIFALLVFAAFVLIAGISTTFKQGFNLLAAVLWGFAFALLLTAYWLFRQRAD